MSRLTMADSHPFDQHLALLDRFIDRHRESIERIEATLLNVRDKPTARRRDRPFFERLLDACFYELPGIQPADRQRRGQLAALHHADGFEATRLDRYTNELDPLELLIRVYEHWTAHRWPGRSGRLTAAGSLWAVYLLRHLEWLSLRIWDATGPPSECLAEVQRLLDRVNQVSAPAAFLRDARWLIQTAQGPLTPHLAPYLAVAGRISALSSDDRLATHAAGAVLGAGHLRSQVRYGMWANGGGLDDSDIRATTRNSNALDTSLLVRDLTPLLQAFGEALASGDVQARARLSGPILQGLSADPELFLVRLDLLAPYTGIEEIWLEDATGNEVRPSVAGEANQALLAEYAALVGQLASSLVEDVDRLRGDTVTYSPFGIVYGFAADMLANMAMTRMIGSHASDLSLEDMFEGSTRSAEKLAIADAWTALPRRPGERAHFEHSTDLSAEVLDYLRRALVRRADRPAAANASDRPTARLVVRTSRSPVESSSTAHANQTYVLTTDAECAREIGATVLPEARLLRERAEGSLLASAEADGGWWGVSKFVLASLAAASDDVIIAGVPEPVVARLRLAFPSMVCDEG